MAVEVETLGKGQTIPLHQLTAMLNERKCTFKRRNGSVAERLQFAQNTQNTLMAQPQYAAITPSPAEVVGIINAILPYQAECAARNFVHKPQRDEMLIQLDNALANQCRWINGMAMGNIDFLANSGFALNKIPEQRPEPAQAVNVKIVSLPDGTTTVSCDHVAGAEWYQVRVDGPNGFVKWSTGAYPKFKLSDLVRGVTLNVYMRAVNYRGQGEWSTPSSFVAQVSPFTSDTAQ